MLLKTKAIILRSRKYSESSMIVDAFTEEKGLRSYIISGVRAKRSKVSAGLLQVMSLVDMVVYHRDDKDLTRIKEIKAAYNYQRIPFRVMRGAVGMFMVEVAQKAIRIPEENRELFTFLYDYFQFLDTTESQIGNLHLKFMLDLAEFLGFMPGDNYDAEHNIFDLQEGYFIDYIPEHYHYVKEPNAQRLFQLINATKENCHELPLERIQRKQILQSLIDYYRSHIENLPNFNAHAVLETVLS